MIISVAIAPCTTRNVITWPMNEHRVNQCCQHCGFPTKLCLCFCVVADFFEDLRVACFWACFSRNLLVFWACFLQISVLLIAFFKNFMALLLFQYTAKDISGVFLWKFAHFGLVFSDLPPCFFIWFCCWLFVLLNFHANACWACFSVKLPIFRLFFKFTCLLLQNNLASLVLTSEAELLH